MGCYAATAQHVGYATSPPPSLRGAALQAVGAMSSKAAKVPDTALPMDAGGAVTFEGVYRSEFAYVWQSLRRLGVAPSDLEDLAHDVFLKVHKALPTYDRARPLKPWLFGV